MDTPPVSRSSEKCLREVDNRRDRQYAAREAVVSSSLCLILRLGLEDGCATMEHFCNRMA